MSARILHFGMSDLNRLRAFKEAEYVVDSCATLTELQLVLHSARQHDAILFSESDGSTPGSVISLVRASSGAPLILFQSWTSNSNRSNFDLVIPALAPAEKWLQEIAELIERSQ